MYLLLNSLLEEALSTARKGGREEARKRGNEEGRKGGSEEARKRGSAELCDDFHIRLPSSPGPLPLQLLQPVGQTPVVLLQSDTLLPQRVALLLQQVHVT